MTATRDSRRWTGASTRVLLLCLCLCELASCSTTTSVPASRREAREVVHVVKSGETLYKIASHYRIDQQELASWNGIRDPNELRVGQRLRLVPPRGYVAAAPTPAARSADATPQPPPTRATTAAPRPSTSTTAPKRATTLPSVGHDQRSAVAFGAAGGFAAGRVVVGARAGGAEVDVDGRGVVVVARVGVGWRGGGVAARGAGVGGGAAAT